MTIARHTGKHRCSISNVAHLTYLMVILHSLLACAPYCCLIFAGASTRSMPIWQRTCRDAVQLGYMMSCIHHLTSGTTLTGSM
jgi:hypothetical protein